MTKHAPHDSSAAVSRGISDAIEADIDFVDFVYYGSLAEGSVRSVKLDEIVDVDDYSVAAFDGSVMGLILQAHTVLIATVRYLDLEELRDREEDIIPTELETGFRTHAHLKLYVSIDLSTLRFKETEMLTREVMVE